MGDLELLSIPEGLFEREEGTLSIARTRTSAKDEIQQTTYILQSPNEGTKAKNVGAELVNTLKRKGVNTQTLSWPPSPGILNGKAIISLLELDGPLVGDLSQIDFETLKIVATQCSQLLWVSTGDDPVMGAALGYLRVLRNENPNLGLKYLLVEDRERPAEKIANVITKVASNPNIDSEFIETDGYLCINRWVADSVMTKLTAKDETTGLQDYMPIGESGFPLKLVGGKSGSSDSAYFTVDDNASSKLGDDEVEVEVRAMALK